MLPKKERRRLGLHRHHRRPRSIGGDNSNRNISLVCRDKHEAWHRLFRNHEAEDIARIINEVWLDPNKEFVCVSRKEVIVCLPKKT